MTFATPTAPLKRFDRMPYLLGLSLAACGAVPDGQSAGKGAADMAPALAGIHLSGAASADSIAATRACATGAGWTDIVVTEAQSFRMVARDRPVATLVTGAATLASDVPGCFAAVVRGDRVALVPTIGQGDYETTRCGRPVAVGMLPPGEPVGIGVIFQSYSPNAQVFEPVALRWVRSTNSLSIDPVRSRRASLAGAQSIAAMRRALQ